MGIIIKIKNRVVIEYFKDVKTAFNIEMGKSKSFNPINVMSDLNL